MMPGKHPKRRKLTKGSRSGYIFQSSRGTFSTSYGPNFDKNMKRFKSLTAAKAYLKRQGVKSGVYKSGIGVLARRFKT